MKALDASIKVLEPLNHQIVAVKVVETTEDRVLACDDVFFACNERHGLWR